MAVTAILSGMAFPGVNVLTLLGGPSAMIESPVLEELKDYIRKQFEAEFRQQAEAEFRKQVEAERKQAEAEIRKQAEAEIRKQTEAELRKQAEDARLDHLATLRDFVISSLEARFGMAPSELRSGLAGIEDVGRLREFHHLAVTCPDIATFSATLAKQ